MPEVFQTDFWINQLRLQDHIQIYADASHTKSNNWDSSDTRDFNPKLLDNMHTGPSGHYPEKTRYDLKDVKNLKSELF